LVDDATRDQVSRLLKRGLNHYGLGEIEKAVSCWEKVRELDPENSAARDYLESAYEELAPRPSTDDGTRPTEGPIPDLGQAPEETSEEMSDDTSGTLAEAEEDGESDDLVGGALALYRSGKLEEARERLEQAAQLEADRLDIQGYLELVRGQLVKRYEKEIGDRGRVVQLAVASEELVQQELGPEEGFLLSQIDGSLTVDEILSLSTFGHFRTIEMLARLLRDGVIE
jgi:tetratricopeptide (TPR) repeat protein